MTEQGAQQPEPPQDLQEGSSGGPADQQQVGPVVFACAGPGGFEARADRLLGSFDGRDARDLHAYAVAGADRQLLVSMHEHLHHELQWSTTWGVIAAMAGLLSGAGIEPERLRGVATFMNRRAKRVHETFATTISVGVLGVETGRSMLTGNHEYIRYLDKGLSLGGDATRWPWQFRESATQMLLRLLMQPKQLLTVAHTGFDRMTPADLAGIPGPDLALSRVSDAGTWWDDAFANLAAANPGRGGDTGGAWARSLPSEPIAMNELKLYEEAVLIPALAGVSHQRLAELGCNALHDHEYLETVELLRESFSRLAPPDWEIEVLADRRPMDKEPLGAERERIYLHATAAVAELVSADQLHGYAFTHERGSQNCVLVIYLPGSIIASQFGLTALANASAVLALAGRPFLDENEQRHVPLAVLKPPMTPKGVEEAFKPLPVTLLTSLSLTRQRELRDDVLAIDTAFVLIDLPLNLQIEFWASDGWTTRFVAIDLKHSTNTTLLLFHLDELPGLYFMSYRAVAGFAELAQLMDRHPKHLVPGLDPGEGIIDTITMITRWLYAAWWRIQEADNL